jgi:hypothetical protein
MDCQIAFVGFFAKLDYCIKEYDVPLAASKLIHLARKEMFPERNKKQVLTEEALKDSLPHNLKATALLVYYLCGKIEIPSELKAHFPQIDRKNSWGKFEENVLRVVVEKWDEAFIFATEENNGTTVQICYGKDNKVLTRNGESQWDYLNDVLWEGAQLNLVRVRRDESGTILMPELIILEPDYLINVTTIASCFESYAESPFVNLVNKIKPQANSMPIHLGNLAGQLLDDTVHEREIDLDDSLKSYVNANALKMISCPELISNYPQFKQDAQIQKRNIEHLIGEALPNVIGNYDKGDVILEPSFFSEVLGIQGRLDFLYQKDGNVTIIEQKSGKGEYVRSSPDPSTPIAKETHTIQVLLYRALFQYEFQTYASQLRHIMLLYSKYTNGLLLVPQSPELLHRAIKMRNLLAWTEIMYARDGMKLLKTLTPEKLNKNGLKGTLWDRYVRPQLSELLSPIQQASALEQAYYLRFLRFIQNELLLSKIGNKKKENSGFASIWHDTLEDKKSAGNIFDKLRIKDFVCEDEAVSSVILEFTEPQSADAANFRIGDIVILYSYRQDEVPNACADMVIRASIVDMNVEAIELRLRNSQTESKVFSKPDGTLWAIEHDMLESMTGALFSAMHGFLSGTKSRRDLILAQREPSVDASLTINGEYGRFNTLVTRAKQARDIFLIIGPPGTGKTSFGLVNLLKEELTEPDTNILLLSYTNRAVDEICEMLETINPKVPYLRIGNELNCSPQFRPHLMKNLAADCSNRDQIRGLFIRHRIIVSTVSSLASQLHTLFKLKHFHVAIIDEASQILEPHLLGILSATDGNGKCAIDKFIMIGDHKQLPAVVVQSPKHSVVQEKILLDIGLKDRRNSLFERLYAWVKEKNIPNIAATLLRQGRMHPEVGDFANAHFYGGKLLPVPVAHQTENLEFKKYGKDFQEYVATTRFGFIHCDYPKIEENNKSNQGEARIVAALVGSIYQLCLLNKLDFNPAKRIGIIVPFRGQIAMIRKELALLKIPQTDDIVIDTVERFQGSQRDIMIFSTTISQLYQLNILSTLVEIDGELIDRKLNVALTRAKKQMFIVGNAHLLEKNPLYKELIRKGSISAY